MIWLDITDPKYVLFFKEMICQLKNFDEIIITTRANEGYTECIDLLRLFGIAHYQIGGHGGEGKLGKFQARLQRQNGFLQLFESLGVMPTLFICGASVEGVQTAYALGIPIINFADTPIAGNQFDLQKITILARLTLPLSSLIFRPFIVPEECYCALGIARENVVAYSFIDVALWLGEMQRGEDFRKKLGLKEDIPTILVREEEYKAHYVVKKLPIIYESIELLASNLNVQIIIMPRYEVNKIKEKFLGLLNVHILDEKLNPNCFYPYIDLLVGGGGTMNLESCYLGIPTISTRSLFLFHDSYLIENGLMQHAKTPNEVVEYTKTILKDWTPLKHKQKFQTEIFEKEKAGFEKIISEIERRGYFKIP